MAFVITRKQRTESAPGTMPTVRVKGVVVPRPIRWPDDVRLIVGQIKAMGYTISDQQAQALWYRISKDHYPIKGSTPKHQPWLQSGYIFDLVQKHAMEYLEVQ